MLGRDHQKTSVGIAGAVLFYIYKNQHLPLNLALNHLHSGIGFFSYTQLFAGLILLISISIGSLLPDIDSSNSLINKRLKIKPKYLTHHGVCHSLIGWLIFCLISLIVLLPIICKMKLIGTMIYLGFIFGYILHLIEDSFSRSGIIWTYPFGEIDQRMYAKYKSINRPVVRFANHQPVRHWWGRGYKVGSNREKKFANLVKMIGLFLLIWTVL